MFAKLFPYEKSQAADPQFLCSITLLFGVLLGKKYGSSRNTLTKKLYHHQFTH